MTMRKENKGQRFYVADVLRVASWEDITSRPAYVKEIDPSKTKPVEVIAAYSLPDEGIRCGLKDCHQPHDNGFLVLTTDGSETNIGRICGKNIFGDEFKDLARKFIEWKRDQDRKEILNQVLDSKQALRERIENVNKKTFGAHWLYKSVRNFRNGYPDDVVSEVLRRARNEEPRIESVRERTAEEVQLFRTMNEGDSESYRYETTIVGELRGLRIFRDSVRDLVVEGLTKRLDELEGMDPETISPRKVAELGKWASSIEDLFSEIEKLLAEGQAFFSSENLKLLSYLDASQEAKRKMENLKWNIREGVSMTLSYEKNMGQKQSAKRGFSLAQYYKNKKSKF